MFDLNKFLEMEKNLPGYVDRSTFVEKTYYRKGKVVAVVTHGGVVSVPNDSEIKDCVGVTAVTLSANFPVVEVDEHLDEFRAARAAANKKMDDMYLLFWSEFFEHHNWFINDKKTALFKTIVYELVDEKSIQEYYDHAEHLIELVK